MNNIVIAEDLKTFVLTSFTPDEVIGCLTLKAKVWAAARDPLNETHEDEAREFIHKLFHQLLQKDCELPAYNRGYSITEPIVELIKEDSPDTALILMCFDHAPLESEILLNSTRIIICPLDVLIATDD